MRIEIGYGLEEHFRAKRFGEGVERGIKEIGRLLEKHFPIGDNNKNELPNKPVIL